MTKRAGVADGGALGKVRNLGVEEAGGVLQFASETA
jgi:hypothetical protein